MTTIMQPFQCDLQPQIPKHTITTHAQAHPKQLEATVSYNAAKKRQTDRSRTRRMQEVPFIAACSHFTRKNTRFRAPASSPKQSPCNNHAAIPMRSATTDSKTPYNYAHTHKHSQSSLKPPLQCCNKKKQTDRSRTRRTQEVPFIAACSHFTRKNARFRAPASSPTQAPCNIHASQFFCDVLLCSVKSHTALHQGQFIL